VSNLPQLTQPSPREFTAWQSPAATYTAECCQCSLRHVFQFRVTRRGKRVDGRKYAAEFRVKRLP
jgi:hypothetical protein